MYSLLADPEGWSLRPWEIARLTDWQIENLYLRPMRKKAEEQERQSPHQTRKPTGGQPTKEQYVRDSMHLFGGTREKWGMLWERFQEQDRQQAGG